MTSSLRQEGTTAKPSCSTRWTKSVTPVKLVLSFCSELASIDPLSFPATHTLCAFLECTGQGVISSPQQHFATLRRACEDKLHGANVFLPSSGKELRKLPLACQRIWHRKIVLTENPPNLPACKQVAR